MVQGHTSDFGATKSSKDGPHCDILDGGGWEIGILGKCCTEDLELDDEE